MAEKPFLHGEDAIADTGVHRIQRNNNVAHRLAFKIERL